MTPAEIKDLTNNIANEVNSVGDFIGIIDPALIPLIAIGKAVNRQLPGIAEHVASWIQGAMPTDQEKADLAEKIQTLSDPTLP